MSFPLIVIVPSFFIVMLALPVVIDTESAAVITRFLPTLSLSSWPIEVVRAFVNRYVMGDGERDTHYLAPERRDNFKGVLQELARDRKLPPPRYIMVKERGPEHSKMFTIEVRLGPDWVSQAEGPSKKSAAQNAAREVLARIMEQNP